MPIALYIVPRPLANSLDRNQQWRLQSGALQRCGAVPQFPQASVRLSKNVRTSETATENAEGELKIQIKYVLKYTHLPLHTHHLFFYLFNFLQIIYFLVKFKTKKSIPMYHVRRITFVGDHTVAESNPLPPDRDDVSGLFVLLDCF